MDDLDRALDAAARNTQAKRERGRYATAVAIEVGPDGADCLSIRYANGCEYRFPVYLLEAVAAMTPEQRRRMELDPSGWYLRWEEPDWEVYIPDVIEGYFGYPDWMAGEGDRVAAYRQGLSRSLS